mmetsp:Transcript_36401/g.84702  ORF Transcript_36401/g.84702 Transcript_36401/m.84702 type:complete len:249 (+) Transcript_36401:1006-1752(+)
MRDLPEVWGAVPCKGFLSLSRHKIGLHFHDHVVPRHHRCHRVQNPADAVVVHARDAKIELWLVVGGLVAPALGFPQAAAGSPRQDLAVTQLHIPRILLEERVEPVKSPLVRNTNGEHDVVPAVCRLHGGSRNQVSLCGALQHPAVEGEWTRRVWPKEHLHSDAAERHMWEERLSCQVHWQRLRLRDAVTISEEADCVGVGTFGIQVQEHAHDLVAREALRSSSLLALPGDVESLGIEEGRIVAVAQNE